MEEPFLFMKSWVLNFKLNNCCCLAPVRIGLLAIAYFNIMYDLTSIVNIADGIYISNVKQLEQQIFGEQEIDTPIPLLCYAAELVFNVMLLCAIYRKDVELMRTYIYCCLVAVTASILLYPVVMPMDVGVMLKITFLLSILFQIYVIILVRSAIVEIKIAKRNGDLPSLIMSTVVHKTNTSTPAIRDIEPTTEEWPVISSPTVLIVDETNNKEKSGSKVKTDEKKLTTPELKTNKEDKNVKDAKFKTKKEKNTKETELKINKEKNTKESELKINKEKNTTEAEVKNNKVKNIKEAELKISKEKHTNEPESKISKENNTKETELKTKVETQIEKTPDPKGNVEEATKKPDAKAVKEKKTFSFLSKKRDPKIKADSKIEPDVKLESVDEHPKSKP